MCPACLTTAALAFTGVTSAGGLTALVLKKIRAPNSSKSIDPTTQSKGAQDESSHYRVKR